MKKIFLSVCMMVKDEEQNLARCLDSIKPLLAAVPSELIIVDTGSQDRTVEIAKRYTEKIYFHAWNNDFSGMRNITISYATGQWILIIDADEEIIKPEGLIAFLQAEHPKDVVGGAVMVKNFLDSGQEKFTVLLSPRLFKRIPGFRYKGRIHNEPVVNGAIKDVGSWIFHYGYFNDDKELMEKKFKRTSTLLLEELAKDPKDIYYRYQLAVSYSMHGDHVRAMYEIQYGYNLYRDDEATLRKNPYVLDMLVNACLNAGVHDDYVVTVGEQALRIEPDYLDVYCHMARLHAKRDEYDKALVYYQQHLNMIENFENLSTRLNPVINHYTLGMREEDLFNMGVMYFKQKKYEKALECAWRIIEEGEKETVFLANGRRLYVEAAMAGKEFLSVKKLYDYLLQKEEYVKLKEMELTAELWWKDLSSDDQLAFCDVFQASYGLYGSLNKTRLHENNSNDFMAKAKEADLVQLPDYYGVLLLIALKGEHQEFFRGASESVFISFMGYLSEVYTERFFAQSLEYVQQSSVVQSADFWLNRTVKNIAKYLLFSGKLSELQFTEVFQAYITAGSNYLSGLYHSDTIEEERVYELKNVEEACLLYVLRSFQTTDRNEKIKYLELAAHHYPDMHKGIKLLLEKLSQELTVPSPMEELLQQLLAQLTVLVEQQCFREALEIIAESEAMVGKDIRLLMMKTKIFRLQAEDAIEEKGRH